MPRWLAAFVLVLVALGLAGLSGSSWLHGAEKYDRLFTDADRQGQHELWGTSRGIRSDEWGVETPKARAQQLAGFPLVNVNEGLGELERNTYDIPILDWGLPIRPLSWPYFVPLRWAHGARWFFRDALLLVGLYALFTAFVDQKRIAATAAAAVFFSSAWMWWRSTSMVGFMGFLCLTGGLAARALRDRRPVWFVLTGWSAACAFCIFYPPVWAPMLWVVCAAVFDFGRQAGRFRAAALLVGLVAAGGLVGLFYQLPYLALVSGTVYPGNRVASAGELPPVRLLEMVWPSLTASAPVHCGPARELTVSPSNVCEASSVEVLPFLVLPALALVSARVRRAFVQLVRSRPVSIAAFAVLSAWLFLPLPAWFGSLTLLRWSPAARAWMAYGVAAALLVCHLLATLRTDPQEESFRWRGFVGVAVVAGCAYLAKGHIRLDLVNACYARAWIPPVAMAAALLCAGAFLCGTGRGATILVLAWVGSVVFANHRVNPLVASGKLFAEGEGHRVVESALARAPGRVMDYSTHFGAYLAAFGWPMLAGTQTSPDLGLFRFLAADAPGLTEELYNRYVHYNFELPPARTRMLSPDAIRIALSPCSRRVATLGVNHLLILPGSGPEPACASEWTSQAAGELRLWSRRTPICPVGVAPGRPNSALDFDYSCPGQARIRAGVSAFSIDVPPDPSRSWSVALNSRIVADVDCTGATARFVDAHLVVTPDGGAKAVCHARYLDSGVALRRLLKK